MDGCPRYFHPSNPQRSYDNPVYRNENIDARAFEPIGDHDSEWRDDAVEAAEDDQSQRIEGASPEERESEFTNRNTIINIYLSARHMTAMLHNGLTNRNDNRLEMDNVNRRIR